MIRLETPEERLARQRAEYKALPPDPQRTTRKVRPDPPAPQPKPFSLSRKDRAENPRTKHSESERAIVALLVRGYPVSGITRALKLNTSTTAMRLSRMRARFGVASNIELVAALLRLGEIV